MYETKGNCTTSFKFRRLVTVSNKANEIEESSILKEFRWLYIFFKQSLTRYIATLKLASRRLTARSAIYSA